MTLQRAMNDMIEPIDRHELMDKSEPAEAIEPTERIEPTEPTDSAEPLEPIDNTESSDHNDHLELPEVRFTERECYGYSSERRGAANVVRHGPRSLPRRPWSRGPDFLPRNP